MLVKCSYPFPNGSTTSNPRRFDVDITSFVEDQILTNFHVLPRTFFDVISLVEKSTLFPRTFSDVIWLVEKSTLFPRTFFDVISIDEKSTLFPRYFFDVISLVEKFTLFPRTFIGVISLVDKSTPFPRIFFDVISIVEKTFHHINLMSKNSTSFLVSYKLMKTFEEVFLCL